MNTRLDSTHPLLAKQLRALSNEQRMLTLARVCRFVVEHAGLEDSTAATALHAMATGCPSTRQVREELNRIAVVRDREYLQLAEIDTCEAQTNAAQKFSEARAFAALAYASSFALPDAEEALYECLHAVADMNDVIKSFHGPS